MSNPEVSPQSTNPNQSRRGEFWTRKRKIGAALGLTAGTLIGLVSGWAGFNIGKGQPKEFDPSTTGRITATGPDGREGELSVCVGNGANVRGAPGITTGRKPVGMGEVLATFEITGAKDRLQSGTPVSDLEVGSIACTRTAGVDFVTDSSTGTTWVKLPRGNSSNPAYRDLLNTVAKTGNNPWTVEENVLTVPVSPDYRTATTTGVSITQE